MNRFEPRTASNTEPSIAAHALPRSARLRKRPDYVRIQNTGQRVRTRHFVIMCVPASGQRIGITVTRRVAGAVGRNRVKRLVREVFRRNRSLFPQQCDCVVLARDGAHALDYATVEAEVTKASASMLRALKGSS